MSENRNKNPFSQFYGETNKTESSITDEKKAPKKMHPQKPTDGRIRVMVELDAATAQRGASAMRSEFGEQGLIVDKVLGKAPRTNRAAGMAEGREGEAFVVRGTIPEEKLNSLKSDPRVKKVNLVVKDGIKPFQCPIPPCDCQSWIARGTIDEVARYLEVDKLWADGYKGQGIVVGIVDGGITAQGRQTNSADTGDPNWPNILIKNVLDGWVPDWGTTGVTWGWHGNMCATDVLGIAPEAKLYDLRIADADGDGASSDQAFEAIDWAIERHRRDGTPQILTNSWGVYNAEDGRHDIEYANDINHLTTQKYLEAIQEGIIVLFAAGNCGLPCGNPVAGACGNSRGPGKSILAANAHPDTIAVGAVNKNEEYVGYSSQGPSIFGADKPDFCSITHFKGYYADADSGTSAATPVAAGVIALLKQAYPSLTHEQVRTLLRDTSKDIGPTGRDQYSGSGIIRPRAAYDQLKIGRIA